MKTLKTQVPRHHLKTFQFYANHFGITVEALMQRELYGQAETLTDYVFWTLEMLDDDHTTENLEPVILSLANEAHALLSRVSELLRRPLDELAQDLLSAGGVVLADHISDALKRDGMDLDPHVPGWAKEAVLFDLAAKRERLPVHANGFDCWDNFAIQKPKKKSPSPRVRQSATVL